MKGMVLTDPLFNLPKKDVIISARRYGKETEQHGRRKVGFQICQVAEEVDEVMAVDEGKGYVTGRKTML